MTTGLNYLDITTLVAAALAVIVLADIAKTIWRRRWRRHVFTPSLRLDVPASRLDPARWHLAHTVFAGGFGRRSGVFTRFFHRSTAPSDAYDALFLENRVGNAPVGDTAAEDVNA